MEMTHLGSIIWSYTWRRTGAIFCDTRPATIMRSAWRGEARNTSMPKRLRSKSAAPTAIISMAQQASPNVTGHTLMRRAHLTRSSRRPVKKLCWRSSRPTRCSRLRRPARRRGARAHPSDGGLGGPLRRHPQSLGRAPVERPVAHQVEEREEDDGGEHEHFDEAERAQL